MILRGDGTWPFSVSFFGSFRVEKCIATWFGGDDDPQDAGQTACGYPTKGHPELLGCSLPMEFCDRSLSTRGSPLPRMPWGLSSKGVVLVGGTQVKVWRGAEVGSPQIIVPLIDNGPAKSASRVFTGAKYFYAPKYVLREAKAKAQKEPHAIDLTQAAFKALGGNLKEGIMLVSYTVLGL